MTVRTWHRLAATTTALAVPLLLAVPAANAARPIRTVEGPREFVIPAGEGCPDFDVHVKGVHHTRLAHKQFADGREVDNNSATIILTNVDTGQSVKQRSHYMSVTTIDPDTGDFLVDVHGRQFISFWPGDIGPGGSVVTENTMLSVVGHQTLIVDPETFAYRAYDLDGRIAFDICAALSG